MIANEIRVGKTLLHNDIPHKVVDISFVRPGKGNAVAQVKMKNLFTGAIIQHRYHTTENVFEAEIENWNAEYLYKDNENYYFMNKTDFDQVSIPNNLVGDSSLYLLENQEVHLVFYQGKCIGFNLQPNVILTVKEAPPNVKGNTASGGTKPCIMETGLVVNCPFFVEEGQKIKIDTESGKYLERA